MRRPIAQAKPATYWMGSRLMLGGWCRQHHVARPRFGRSAHRDPVARRRAVRASCLAIHRCGPARWTGDATDWRPHRRHGRRLWHPAAATRRAPRRPTPEARRRRLTTVLAHWQVVGSFGSSETAPLRMARGSSAYTPIALQARCAPQWPVEAKAIFLAHKQHAPRSVSTQALPRAISSKPRSTTGCLTVSPRISASSIADAAWPTSARGVRTVVSGGTI